MTLPPEMCGECGKEISRRARANVIADRVVCTACWRKLDSERKERDQWEGPASVRQTGYASGLGLRFPTDATWGDLHDILSRRLDYDGDDTDAPQWLADYGRSLGLWVSRFSGTKQLYDGIFRALDAKGDQALAQWFAFNIAREVAPAASEASIGEVAAQLAADPRVMKSVRKYGGTGLIDFGTATGADGTVLAGGSNRTIAYTTAAELFRSRRDVE